VVFSLFFSFLDLGRPRVFDLRGARFPFLFDFAFGLELVVVVVVVVAIAVVSVAESESSDLLHNMGHVIDGDEYGELGSTSIVISLRSGAGFGGLQCSQINNLDLNKEEQGVHVTNNKSFPGALGSTTLAQS
jgi:hypothetical protein